jgi:putative transposase
MKAAIQAFLLMLAGSTDKELAKQVKFLKAENRILRAKLPERITITTEERSRLLKYGKALGKAIKDLITIVTPRTFMRWLSAENSKPKKAKSRPAKPGRPKTHAEIRELILKLARENSWGYTRILGELRKLGIGKSYRRKAA